MEIFNLVREHFALLAQKSFRTLSQRKDFDIQSVDDWRIWLKVSTEKTDYIFISDLLRIYTFVVSENRSLKTSEISKNVKCFRGGTASYAIPLLGTFSDIEIKKERAYTIRYNPQS